MSVPPLRCWEDVEAFALSLPDTERGTTYRMSAVKAVASGRSFVWTSHEAETSFAIWLEPGSNAVLVRYSSNDPERVCYMIEQAYNLAAALKPIRKRNS